jgi:hypothetical protein
MEITLAGLRTYLDSLSKEDQESFWDTVTRDTTWEGVKKDKAARDARMSGMVDGTLPMATRLDAAFIQLEEIGEWLGAVRAGIALKPSGAWFDRIEQVWAALRRGRIESLARTRLQLLIDKFAPVLDERVADGVIRTFALQYPEYAKRLRVEAVRRALAAWRTPRGNGGKWPAFEALLAQAGLAVADARDAARKRRRRRTGGR